MKEYFSHDYNARNDKKLIKLFMKQGVSGIGIYWCIIEMLFEEKGYLNLDEYERISFELRINNDTIKSVIEDFELFENDGTKFWSESAIERLTERMNKSTKARASVMKRWNKTKEDTNVLQPNNDSSTIKVKESKGKESKNSLLEKVYFEKSKPVNDAFIDYLKLRIQSKFIVTDRAINTLVNKLRKQSENNPKKAIDIIENAIVGKWKTFYNE